MWRLPVVLSVLVVFGLPLAGCDSGWDFACNEFDPVDMTMHFTGFDDYVGRELSLRVAGTTNWNPPDPGPWEEIFRTEIVIPSGEFMLYEAGGGTTCLSLHVDFFVDRNSNGTYDAPPTDHAWRIYEFAWEDDGEIEFTFTFTLDASSCGFEGDGTPVSCKYLDIEWPAS